VAEGSIPSLSPMNKFKKAYEKAKKKMLLNSLYGKQRAIDTTGEEVLEEKFQLPPGISQWEVIDATGLTVVQAQTAHSAWLIVNPKDYDDKPMSYPEAWIRRV